MVPSESTTKLNVNKGIHEKRVLMQALKTEKSLDFDVSKHCPVAILVYCVIEENPVVAAGVTTMM